MTATATTSPDEPIKIQLQLQLRSPARTSTPPPSSTSTSTSSSSSSSSSTSSSSATPSITLPRSSSVLQLKQSIHQQWARRPLPSGITCVLGGRVVRDSEVLHALFEQGEGQEPIEPKLFVIVKPDAWTVPEATKTAGHEPPSSSSSSSSVATSTPPPIPAPNDVSGRDTSSTLNPTLAAPASTSHGTSTPATSAIPTLTPNPSQPLPPPPTRSGYNPTYIPSITTPSLVPSTSPYTNFLIQLNALPPLERTTFFLRLIQVHACYTQDVELRSQRFQEYSLGSIERARVGGLLMGFEEGQKVQIEELQNAFEMEGVAEMLKEVGLWGLVEKDMQRAQVEADLLVGEQYEGLNAIGSGSGEGGFRMVTIDNQPYLLHQPAQSKYSSSDTSKPADHQARYLSLQRGRAILSILSTMIHLSISALGTPSNPLETGVSARHQPLIYQMMGLAPPFPHQAGARAPLLGPNVALNALAPRRRGLTISIVLNLEVFVSLFVPLLILSTKLAFLLWIFARRASATKRWVLVGLAGGWVLWEGWSMYKRRVAIVRARIAAANNGAGGAGGVGGGAGGEAGDDRERERDRERRRRRAAAAAAAANPLAADGVAGAAGGPVGIPLDDQQQQDQIRRRAARQQPPPVQDQAQVGQPNPEAVRARARAHRGHGGARRPSSSMTSTSRLSPKYWITRIALIGLVDEALELGLAPRSIAGRPVQYAGNLTPIPGQGQPQLVLPTPQQQQAQQHRSTLRSRTLRTFLICVVLFFGTLIPEVERKRRKALEKRTRLLKEREEWIARMRAVDVVRAERAGATMGMAGGAGGVGVGEATPAGTAKASQGAFQTRTEGQGTSASALDGGGQEESGLLQGRRLVPDSQLFADGLGEPDQLRQYQQRQREISQAQAQAEASGSTHNASTSTSTNAFPSTSTSNVGAGATHPPEGGRIDSGLNTGDNSAPEDGDVDHDLLTAFDLERDLLDGDDGDDHDQDNEGDAEGDVDAMVGLF